MDIRTKITFTEPELLDLSYNYETRLFVEIGEDKIYIGKLEHKNKECLLQMAESVSKLPEMEKVFKLWENQ